MPYTAAADVLPTPPVILNDERKQLEAMSTDESPPPSRLFQKARNIQMTAHGMILAIAIELLTSYITSLLINRSSGASTAHWFQEFIFFILRPRAAPFIGTFGLFEGWYKKGLDVLVVDLIISCFAGLYFGQKYFWSPFPSFAHDPAAPAGQLNILRAGAILGFIPGILVQCWLLIQSAIRRGGFLAAFCYFFTPIGMFLLLWKWFLFLGSLPFVAIAELGIIVSNLGSFRKRKDGSEPRARIEMPLTYYAKKPAFVFLRFQDAYRLLLLSSWVINLGNWLFWVEYLKISGEMFCPMKVPIVTAVWFLVPAALHMLLGALQALAGDSQ